MYAYINGTVADILPSSVVVDVNGIGYELFISAMSLSQIEIGKAYKFYTHLAVKEDDMSLYGFLDKKEKELFLQLLNISGVGPKLAISIVGGMPVDMLIKYIIDGNSAGICGIKGVGKKTAERIVIELKDKVEADPMTLFAPRKKSDDIVTAKAEEAIAILTALGIKPEDAEHKVKSVYDDALTVRQIVNKAIGG